MVFIVKKCLFLDVGVPDEFLCPITREVMKDPVIAEGRFNYWYPLLRNQGVVRGLSE